MGPSGNQSPPPPSGEAGFPRGPIPLPSAVEADFTLRLAYTVACSAVAECNSMPGIAGPLPGTLLMG
eukprot:2803811-Alexandrium_andersonii.AAC.1